APLRGRSGCDRQGGRHLRTYDGGLRDHQRRCAPLRSRAGRRLLRGGFGGADRPPDGGPLWRPLPARGTPNGVSPVTAETPAVTAWSAPSPTARPGAPPRTAEATAATASRQPPPAPPAPSPSGTARIRPGRSSPSGPAPGRRSSTVCGDQRRAG